MFETMSLINKYVIFTGKTLNIAGTGIITKRLLYKRLKIVFSKYFFYTNRNKNEKRKSKSHFKRRNSKNTSELYILKYNKIILKFHHPKIKKDLRL